MKDIRRVSGLYITFISAESNLRVVSKEKRVILQGRAELQPLR